MNSFILKFADSCNKKNKKPELGVAAKIGGQ